ncbi:MAG: hypothetical protein EAZ95_12360 [Bacteroidetes bacterium]|nr:MAG: hypothetical protein EAZ95_12360 [Bacteroidota bacterium]
MYQTDKKGYNENGYPSLFHDEEERDLEAFITYFLSWTLRCAISNNEKVSQNIKTYASKVLFALFEIDAEDGDSASCQIMEVKTWKEWNNIDLCVEVTLSSGVVYAIAIECKMYTTLREKQFENYIHTFEEHYKGHNPTVKQGMCIFLVQIMPMNKMNKSAKN